MKSPSFEKYFSLFVPAVLICCSLPRSYCNPAFANENDANEHHMVRISYEHLPMTDFSESENKFGADFYKSHHIKYKCPHRHLSRIGRASGGGGKWVCGLETLGALGDSGYNCTLYSFGVAKDSNFEAQFLQTTPCHVFAFDPTVNTISDPLKANPRVHFQKVGIGGENTAKARTLKTLMEQNGHHFLDVLKLDVGGAEFSSLERMLADFQELPFGQLQVEIHNEQWSPEGRYRTMNLLRNLEMKGARIFHTQPTEKAFQCCSEYSLINLNYLHLFISTNGKHQDK